jgi:pimeloyl-ACP methyl ester carboxylesterase
MSLEAVDEAARRLPHVDTLEIAGAAHMLNMERAATGTAAVVDHLTRHHA